jgi:nicotinate-nucleotide adenylyltransferase
MPGIGVFGGTFDPIHLGHLRAAEEVREVHDLDEMRLVPAAVPPHRRGAVASAADRLCMVELAIADAPAMRAWDVELGRPGRSYSIETLRMLRNEVGPAMRVVFVLGRDAFADFDSWKEHAAIFALCDIVVMTRPPWPLRLALDDFPVASRGAFRYDPTSEAFRHESGHVVALQRITALDISATAIRTRVAARQSIRFLVPPGVESYIASHGLYRQEDAPR